MRKPIIAGNWKMNKTAKEAEALINELKPFDRIKVYSKPNKSGIVSFNLSPFSLRRK